MTIHIALLRGINVGGQGKMPMADLRKILHRLGARYVTTYIQSGNAIFRDKRDPPVNAAQISDAVERTKGFRPECMVLTQADLREVISKNPFPEAVHMPAKLNIFFLSRMSYRDLSRFKSLLGKGEDWQMNGQILYHYAPAGLENSAFAADLEKNLATPVTLRNWSVVVRLSEMAQEVAHR